MSRTVRCGPCAGRTFHSCSCGKRHVQRLGNSGWQQSWRPGADPRPSANEAGHIPRWRGSYESYALWPVAAVAVAVTVAVSRWSWSPSPRSPRTRRRSSFVWPSEEAAEVQHQRRPGRLQRLLRKDSFPHSHRVGPQPSLSRAKATCRPIVPLSNGKRKCPYGFLPCIAQRRWHLAPGAAGR